LKKEKNRRISAANYPNPDLHSQSQKEERASGLRQKRAPNWDPSHSWRSRKSDKQQFLSSLERRYLRDVLLALERSGMSFKNGFLIKPQGNRDLDEVKLPEPLAKLVVHGLITIEKAGNDLRCYLSEAGLEAVENWLLTKPPNFKLMFPRLYHQLAGASRNTLWPRRQAPRR
jgi:hypothetical protein